jgi:hypothetical protein
MRSAISSICVSACLLGCQPKAAEEQQAPAPVPTSAATIPVETVSGTLLGKPFALHTARYTVDRRPRYEKVEIQLLAAKLDKPCEAIGTNHDPAVWLRRTGIGEPKAESVRFSPDEATPWEAHYELFENKDWRGNGTANVMLELHEPAPDLKLHGEIYACFGDRTQSCVSGRFDAIYCPIRVDALVRGTDSMERPSARSGKPLKAAAEGVGALPNEDGPPGAPPRRAAQ